jgi:hypothetical protein
MCNLHSICGVKSNYFYAELRSGKSSYLSITQNKINLLDMLCPIENNQDDPLNKISARDLE